MNLEKYVGFYSLQTLVVEMKVADGRLLVAFPGVPAGFEVVMSPLGDDSFRMESGPMLGATAVFHFNEDGTPSYTAVGGFELTYTTEPDLDFTRTGQGLSPPEMVLDESKVAAFSRLYEGMMAKRDGRFLDYDLPYPKQEFLRYLADQGTIIFHGSGKADIDEFQPVRTSVELRDKTGRGNLQAVYGTHDGLWPLFFAIVDRGRLSGSIRNGVQYFQNESGDEVAVYHFSINEQNLSEKPWREGTLYFLAQAEFFRLELAPGVPANEWACETAVAPIARLQILPEDFPFLDQIGGHDDGSLTRLMDLSKMVIGATTHYEALPKGYALRLDWDDELAKNVLSYITLMREFMPQTEIALRFEPNDGPIWFDLQGAPAYVQLLKDNLEGKKRTD